MKTKYYWDLEAVVVNCILIAISPLFVIIITRNWYPDNLPLIILVIVLFSVLDCILFMLSILDALKETTTFGKYNVCVHRPRQGSFDVSVKKIKRICISMQHINGLSGNNARLAISVNEIDGKIIGVGARMLTAILAIYPHIKVVVLSIPVVECSKQKQRKKILPLKVIISYFRHQFVQAT